MAVVGLDVGTTNVKALAVAADGARLGASSSPIGRLDAGSGRSEQDPDDVTRAVAAVLSDVAEQVRSNGSAITKIGTAGAMHSILGTDARGIPIGPALTWADDRAEAEALRLQDEIGGAQFRRRTGVSLGAGLPVAKVAWFRHHQPHVFEAARRWVSLKDYVMFRLSGEWLTDPATAAASGWFDAAAGDWSDDLLSFSGIDRERVPPVLAENREIPLAAESRSSMGLEGRVGLLNGSSDGVLSNVGAGASSEGTYVFSIGTSAVLRTVGSRYVPAPEPTFCYPMPQQRFLIGAASDSGGAAVAWLQDLLFAGATGSLDELAARAEPGSDGLLFVPRLLGARGLGTGSTGGAVIGLSLRHGRAELARACLEGVILDLVPLLAIVERTAAPVQTIRATGGFARSRLWCQILADVLDRVVELPGIPDAPAVGAAAMGLVAEGSQPDLGAAVDTMDEWMPLPPSPKGVERYRGTAERLARISW